MKTTHRSHKRANVCHACQGNQNKKVGLRTLKTLGNIVVESSLTIRNRVPMRRRKGGFIRPNKYLIELCFDSNINNISSSREIQ